MNAFTLTPLPESTVTTIAIQDAYVGALKFKYGAWWFKVKGCRWYRTAAKNRRDALRMFQARLENDRIRRIKLRAKSN